VTRRRLGVAVAAMMVAAQLGTSVAAAPATIEQLAQMAAYLEANDILGLRAFLLLNPDLAEGDTRFAAIMREFLAQTDDATDYLAFDPTIRDALSGTDDDNPTQTFDGLTEEGSSSY
jgi:hypothetical protein